MKTIHLIQSTVAAAAFTALVVSLPAADPPAGNPDRPNREAPREKRKLPTPEERQERLKQLREQNGGPKLDEFQKFRESLKDLPPAEREAKLREFREKQMEERLKDLPPAEREARLKEMRERLANRPPATQLSPEERETRRKEVRERLDKRLGELRQKKADGTLTEREGLQLTRMEEMAKRFEQNNAPGPRPSPPAPPAAK